MGTFDNNDYEKYKTEVQEKWGNTTAYKEYADKAKHFSKDIWNKIIDEMNDIFSGFAECMLSGMQPESVETQKIVQKLQKHITVNFYTCTNELLAGLGQMYVCDEHFKDNIDKHAEGTAEFVSEAIKAYCMQYDCGCLV